MPSSHPKPEKRVFDSEEDLAVSLAKYIADLSHHFAKKKRLFDVVLSSNASGNWWNHPMLIPLTGPYGTYFGSMRELCPRLMLTATTNSLMMVFSLRFQFPLVMCMPLMILYQLRVQLKNVKHV